MTHPLRAIRQSRKISQETLAAELGVKKAAVSKWETGKVSLTVDRARQIAGILGCTVMDLLGERTPFDAVGPLTAEERDLVLKMRQLAEPERQAVLTLAQSIPPSPKRNRDRDG